MTTVHITPPRFSVPYNVRLDFRCCVFDKMATTKQDQQTTKADNETNPTRVSTLLVCRDAPPSSGATSALLATEGTWCTPTTTAATTTSLRSSSTRTTPPGTSSRAHVAFASGGSFLAATSSRWRKVRRLISPCRWFSLAGCNLYHVLSFCKIHVVLWACCHP